MHGFEPRENWFMSRSGYTGEDGFEIGLPEADARDLVAKLLADERVMWVGLAARDSLRLEAGLCLHGLDITPEIDPASAGLMWAIPKEVRASGAFIGADALRAIMAARPGAETRRPEAGRPPAGARRCALFDADGNPAGHVTSGGFGPSAGHPVAMGYVPASLAKPGTKLFADVRGDQNPGRYPSPALHAASLPQRMNSHGKDLFHRRSRMAPRRRRHRHRRHHRLRAGTARRSRLRRIAGSRQQAGQGRRRRRGRIRSRRLRTSMHRSTARSPRPTPRSPPIRRWSIRRRPATAGCGR